MLREAPRASAVFAGRAAVAGRLERDVLIRIGDDGRVASVEAGERLPPGALDLSSRVVLPGTCNTHSHAFQVLLRGRCETVRSFQEWVSKALYPLVASLDLEAVASASRLAFLEMALNGVTCVGEFHYVHNGPDGEDAGDAYAHVVIAAAREVGLRVVLLRALYDRPGPPARARFIERPEDAIRRVDALASSMSGREGVTVLAAAHSLHGSSARAIAAAHEWSLARGLPMHVHLAEQEGDVEASLGEHGATPLRALQSMGVVDRLLVAVHGCHLDREELGALGAAGGAIAYNPSSNMALGDGVTDVPSALESGVRVALGTDGGCANNQFDVFREMRATEHLQRVTRRRMGVLTPFGGVARLFAMGTVEGYRALGLEGGTIEAGAFADLVALDPDDPSLQPLLLDGDTASDLERLLAQAAFAMSPRAAVTDVIVGGRAIVRQRTSVQVDASEIAARVRVLPQLR